MKVRNVIAILNWNQIILYYHRQARKTVKTKEEKKNTESITFMIKLFSVAVTRRSRAGEMTNIKSNQLLQILQMEISFAHRLYS